MTKSATAFAILTVFFTQVASAVTYRLELTSGKSVTAVREFEFSKATKSVGFKHPNSVGSEMNGTSIEIKDSVASCGTFLQAKLKREIHQQPEEVTSTIVTLVETASIASGKINAKTSGEEKLDSKSQTLTVVNDGLKRTCKLTVVR